MIQQIVELVLQRNDGSYLIFSLAETGKFLNKPFVLKVTDGESELEHNCQISWNPQKRLLSAKPDAAILLKKVVALLDETQRLVKTKPGGKVYWIEWKTKADGTVTLITLRPDKPLPVQTARDYRSLKEEITKLPRGAKVSYVFSDFRPDLLTHR